MLDYFRADNFKSLINVAFEPIGLNLLIGSNNAGKTNLCHALRFLSLASRMSLMEAARRCTPEPWSLANVYFDSPAIELALRCSLPAPDGQLFTFEYELSLSAPRADKRQLAGAAVAVRQENLSVSGGRFPEPTLLLTNVSGKVRLLPERVFLGEQEGKNEFVDMTTPSDHTMLFRLFDLQTNTRANLFKRYLGGWQYYNFDALRLRESTAQPLDTELEYDGSNLASVLFNLKSSEEKLYRKIVDATKRLDPKLDVINFQSPDPEHVYMFFEDEKGKRFSASNISDGTLRYLALCTVIVLNRRRVRSGDGPSLVIIEEPENGIYVGYLKTLFELLDPSGKDGQYIFTSHAPYFIDLFDGCLDGVWRCRWQSNHTNVERPPRQRIEEYLGKFSLGEMHFRGLLQ